MRIVLFCGDPGIPVHGPSGSSAHLRSVARALVSLGHEVHVAVPRDHDRRGRYDAPLGAPAVLAPPRRWPRGLRSRGGRWDVGRLAARVRREVGRADVLWERASSASRVGRRLADALGAVHLLELNAPMCLEQRALPGEAEQIARADRVYAVSPWLARWAERVSGRAVAVVPNGSALQSAPREAARRKWGIEGTTALFVGSGRDWHGLDRFEAIVDEAGVSGLVVGASVASVRCFPWIGTEALSEVASAADVMVAPWSSDAPPWLDPLKLHDARAVGLPTVASATLPGAGADVCVPWGGSWRRGVDEALQIERIARPRSWVQVVREALGPIG